MSPRRPSRCGRQQPYDAVRPTGDAPPDPQWLSAATSQRDVLVIYGPTIGVREEEGHRYRDDNQRRTELEEYRRIGFVAAGIVEFAP